MTEIKNTLAEKKMPKSKIVRIIVQKYIIKTDRSCPFARFS